MRKCLSIRRRNSRQILTIIESIISHLNSAYNRYASVYNTSLPHRAITPCDSPVQSPPIISPIVMSIASLTVTAKRLIVVQISDCSKGYARLPQPRRDALD